MVAGTGLSMDRSATVNETTGTVSRPGDTWFPQLPGPGGAG